ncbi:MAG: radical SAM protein [Pseudomonadota bacterium]
MTGYSYVYGPVYSRRLRRSLGVDLVPFKTCTYDCIYCQIGRTTNKTIERKEYVPIANILAELEKKLAVESLPDYITLAGSGEPTLHIQIGELIQRIKHLTPIPVAVLTNGSLLGIHEVQDALMEADLVIPSLDAGNEHLFQYVNRPHREIDFETMVNGIAEFKERFPRSVWLEVFLLGGVTAIEAEVKKIAALVRRIRPERVQLNTVSRPPAEEFAYSVSANRMEVLANLFDKKAEVISEEETDEALALTLSAVTDKDILALLSRRPCTAQGILSGLGLHIGETTKRLQTMIEEGIVSTLRKDGDLFYKIKKT